MQSKKNHGITALYPRLSRDDDVQGDSNSIVNQYHLQCKYALLIIFSAVPAERGSADFLRADRLYSSIQCRLP